jgi:hypothetical protein
MASWLVPPIVVPAMLGLTIAAWAIYLACVLPSAPVPTLVVSISLLQAEERT